MMRGMRRGVTINSTVMNSASNEHINIEWACVIGIA